MYIVFLWRAIFSTYLVFPMLNQIVSAMSVPIKAMIQTFVIGREPWPAKVARNNTKMFPLMIEPINAIG